MPNGSILDTSEIAEGPESRSYVKLYDHPYPCAAENLFRVRVGKKWLQNYQGPLVLGEKSSAFIFVNDPVFVAHFVRSHLPYDKKCFVEFVYSSKRSGWR
jgi:hypothetical protein